VPAVLRGTQVRVDGSGTLISPRCSTPRAIITDVGAGRGNSEHQDHDGSTEQALHFDDDITPRAGLSSRDARATGRDGGDRATRAMQDRRREGAIPHAMRTLTVSSPVSAQWLLPVIHSALVMRRRRVRPMTL
jgi:hypothetical protein